MVDNNPNSGGHHDQIQPLNNQGTASSANAHGQEFIEIELDKEPFQNDHSNLPVRKDNETNNSVDRNETTSIEFNVDQIKTEDDANDNDTVSDSSTRLAHVEKKKRAMKRELERLGVDFKEENDEFDAFGDNDNIFKKYKFREGRKPSYKIRMDIPFLPDTKKPRVAKIHTEDSTEEIMCSICNKKFSSGYEMRSHFRAQHITHFSCSQCSSKFETNQELISHKIVHKKENRSYLCHECKLAFTDHCDYIIHELTHFGPNLTHVCPECGLKYIGKWSYQAHIISHFDRPMTCPICSINVNGEHNLQQHINKHKRNIECVECGKVLHDKKTYDNHMAIHTGVKKYQCLYCGKGFRTHSGKAVHMRIHTNQRPFSCNICDKTFVQSTDLSRHRERHETIKKYQCDICNNNFVHKYQMTQHKRTHTKQNIYECPECDTKFLSLAGLRTHVLFKHTTERVVKCELCDKSFINKNQYDKHARSKYHKRNEYKMKLNKS